MAEVSTGEIMGGQREEAPAGELKASAFIRRHRNPLAGGKSVSIKAPKLEESAGFEGRGYSPVFSHLLALRGFRFDDEESFGTFVKPQRSQLAGISSQPSIRQGTDFIVKALESGGPIAVFADYDADGVTSAAQLTRVASAAGAEVVPLIPHRILEGYRINERMIKAAIDAGCSYGVVLDLGSPSDEIAEKAKAGGLELLVVDHHHIYATPSRDALVVNWRLNPEEFDGHALCTSGETLLLCMAAAEKKGLDVSFDSLVSLAAIGTVCDVMPLTGPNRIIAALGLEAMADAADPGLRELVKRSLSLYKPGDYDLTPYLIGFEVGPRINAAGRMEDAMDAYRLLITDDSKEAVDLSEKLTVLNDRRKDFEKDVLAIALEHFRPADFDLVILDHNNVPDPEKRLSCIGIMGRVAALLAENLDVPSLVLVENAKGEFAGSFRSIPGINALEILERASSVLSRYGGHEAAAGCLLDPENVAAFQEMFRKTCREKLEHSVPEPLQIDLRIPMEELRSLRPEEIYLLRPFGTGNARPLLIVDNCRVESVNERARRYSEAGFWEVELKDRPVSFRVLVSDPDVAASLETDKPISLFVQLGARKFLGKPVIELEVFGVVPK